MCDVGSHRVNLQSSELCKITPATGPRQSGELHAALPQVHVGFRIEELRFHYNL